MKFISVLESLLLSIFVSSVIFLAIPISNYLGLSPQERSKEKAHKLQTIAKKAPKKKKLPPKKREAPKSQKNKSRITPKQMSRQNLAMDLNPGSGSGGASLEMGSGGGTMTYEEGETDSDIIFVSGRNPQYPKDAAKGNVHGIIEVILTVDENGKVVDIEFVKSIPGYGFEEEINKSVKTWVFKPAMLNGIGVKQKMLQPFEF